MKSKGITIADVALKAEVSPASVSRYLNGVEGNLAPQTAERIARVIEELDYRPNAWARSLKTRKSGLVAAVVADLTNAYVPAVLDGMETQINQAGYSLMIGNTQNDSHLESLLIERLLNQRVEGILIQPSSMRVTPALTAVLNRQVPVVLVDRLLSGVSELDRVGLDNYGAVDTALDHLFAQGYRDLLYVTEAVEDVSSRWERKKAVEQSTLPWRDVRIFIRESAEPAGLIGTLHRVRENRDGIPAAVLCGNSVAALLAVQAITQAGYSVPGDFGLMTIDDPPWAPFVLGGISAVEQPTIELGRQAAQRLLQRIANPEAHAPVHSRLPGVLKARHSTQRS